jgi:hypothetical protein
MFVNVNMGEREYLSLGAGFSREQEMEDTRREVEK